MTTDPQEKTQRSFRLTNEAYEMLEAIGIKYGISRTAMLEILIREKADEEGFRGAVTRTDGGES